jgi:eukaryotic-like serine/threonine-protein kinase
MGEKSDPGTQSHRAPPSSDRSEPRDRRAGTRSATVVSGPPAGTPPPRVERTLEVHDAAARVIARALDSTLDARVAGSGTPPTSSDRLAMLAAHLPSVPRDAYAVGDQVAKGGIGRVMRARDQRLDRPVAIKELLVWNEAQEQRFVREALLTARLQHPAIVPIYEAGRWPDGEPFYAMKLVSGRSLADLIGERKTLAERLALLPHVITAAQAVAYAHSQHILHRDLKPANVLVGELGETVVIDWGLAKGLAEEEARTGGEVPVMSAEGLTIEGAVVGTPAYMPPEQATGSPVDERADIYAIGAMLYHLIAAVPPYHDVPWEKMLSTISTEPPRPVEKHAPAISDELSAIVQKAMARDPRARYQTAKELADDLQRFTSGQIVAAHTYSATQLLRRFWRRNRAVLSIAASAIALVALAIMFAFVKTDQERRIALEKKQEAESARRSADTARGEAEVAGRQATTRADELTLLQAEGALGRDPNEAVAWLKTLSPSFADAGELRRLASDAHARGLSRSFRGHTAHINDITVHPDGTHFVSASDDKTVRLWDMATGKERTFTGHTDEVWRAEFVPGTTRIVTLSKDRTLRAWDTVTGEEVGRLELPSRCSQLAVRADGVAIAAPWDDKGAPFVWRIGDQEGRSLLPPSDEVEWSSVAAGGRWAVIQRKGGAAALVEIDTGKERSLGSEKLQPGPWILSADGRAATHRILREQKDVAYELWDLATMARRTVTLAGNWPRWEVSRRGHLVGLTSDTGIDVYDMMSGALVRRIATPGSPAYWATFSDDNQTFATGDYDKMVRVWDLGTGAGRAFAGLRGAVSQVDFLPDHRSVLAASTSGDIRLFEPPRSGSILTDHRAPSSGLSVAPDGRSASIDEQGKLRVLDAKGQLVVEHALGPAPDLVLFVSPDGARFAGAALQGKRPPWMARPESKTLLFGTFDAAKPAAVELPARTSALTWHPGSGSVFVALQDGSVHRVMTDGTIAEIDRLEKPAVGAAVSADGAWLAVGGEDGLVRLTELATGKHRDLGRHADSVAALAFSRDGRVLATGSIDHTVRLWRLADGTFRSIDASGAGVQKITFANDERSIFVRNQGETILRRWVVETGEQLPPLTGHAGPIGGFSFSSDGRRVLTWSLDRSVRIFDVATGKSRALVGHKDKIVHAAFAAGARLVLTLGVDGAVRAWPDDLPETLPELRGWLEAATSDRIEGR